MPVAVNPDTVDFRHSKTCLPT